MMIRLFSILNLMLLFSFSAVAQKPSDNSIPELMSKAQSGDKEAQFQLARAYEDGSGVEQNDDQAVQWYRKAAEQSYSKAQNSLGFMYRGGRGVPKDKAEAALWYLKAAKQCDPNGAYNTAIAYYNGDGLSADLGNAFVWLLVAKQCGNTETKSALDRVSAEMTPKQREIGAAKFIGYMVATPDFTPDVAQLLAEMGKLDSPPAPEICQAYVVKDAQWRDSSEAKGWCEKAVAEGDWRAYATLGNLAEERNDFPEAAKLYKRGVEKLLDPPALEKLAKLYLEGKGVQKDPAKAYFWLFLATKLLERKYLGPEFDLAAQQLSDKEKKRQEKKAKNWLDQWQDHPQ